jgi:hypothetical protein
MPLLHALRIIADGIIRTLRVIIATVSRSVTGIRWLTGVMRRLRGRGSGGASGPARLFDVHAVVVAADLALLAGLLQRPVKAALLGWSLAGAAALALAVLGTWLVSRVPAAGRATIGLTLLARAVATVIAAYWLSGSVPLLLGLVAVMLPQWAVHLAVLRRLLPAGAPRVSPAARACAYGLIAGLLAAVGAIIGGWLMPSWPRWVAVALLALGALLALRLPSDSPPSSQPARPPHDPQVPQQPAQQRRAKQPPATQPPATQPRPATPGQQTAAPAVPEGFHVYRPSSLDSVTDGDPAHDTGKG